MSLALYAVVKPSRILWTLTCGICFCVLIVAGTIGLGLVGQFAGPSRFLVAATSVFIAFSVLYQQAGRRSEFHIHISGSGQLRLAKLTPLRSVRFHPRPVKAKAETEAVLLPASTIWPWLLLLRLQLNDKTVMTVPVLPDCLPADTFRALSVACRWLAAHDRSMKY